MAHPLEILVEPVSSTESSSFLPSPSASSFLGGVQCCSCLSHIYVASLHYNVIKNVSNNCTQQQEQTNLLPQTIKKPDEKNVKWFSCQFGLHCVSLCWQTQAKLPQHQFQYQDSCSSLQFHSVLLWVIIFLRYVLQMSQNSWPLLECQMSLMSLCIVEVPYVMLAALMFADSESSLPRTVCVSFSVFKSFKFLLFTYFWPASLLAT